MQKIYIYSPSLSFGGDYVVGIRVSACKPVSASGFELYAVVQVRDADAVFASVMERLREDEMDAMSADGVLEGVNATVFMSTLLFVLQDTAPNKELDFVVDETLIAKDGPAGVRRLAQTFSPLAKLRP